MSQAPAALQPEPGTELEIRLGGRDAPVLANVYPWQSPFELWLIKTGRIPKPNPANDAIWLGQALEAAIADRFAEERGVNVRRDNKLLRHRSHKHLVGRIDRRITGAQAGLEVKTSAALDDWGESGTDEVPAYVLLQCAHYMLVTGWERWYVAALLFSRWREFRWYEIPRDEELIAMLLERELEFYARILEDRAPPTANPDHVRLRYPRSSDRVFVASEDVAGMVAELSELRALMKQAEERADVLEAQIMTSMADAATVLVHPEDARPLVTWKSHTRTEFDRKRFRADHPDLWQQYAYELTVRPFRLAKAKELVPA